MAYKVVLSKGAEEDLDRFVAYLLFEKKSEQAARNLLNDTVYVDNIFHELQDYENKMN